MSGHITIGYNATPSSAAAVFWAAEEAAARGAQLRIVSCRSAAPTDDAHVTGPDLEPSRPGDLLVVGSRGHSAITSTLFGSTVNRLLNLSPFPVAVVRERGAS